MPVFFMNHMIDSVQMNHIQVLIREKNEWRVALLLEFFCFAYVLRIDNPNHCAIFKFMAMFDQLPQLVIAPYSPLATHKDKHDGLADTQFLRKRA